MIILLSLFLFVNIAWSLQTTSTPQIPDSPCPDIYVYDSDGNKVYGKIMIPNLPKDLNQIIMIEAKFIQREAVIGNFFCGMLFRENLKTTQEKLLSGEALSFYTYFPNGNVAPALESIKINRFNTICKNSRDEELNGRNVIKMIFVYVRTENGIQSLDNLYNFGTVKGWGCTISNKTDIDDITTLIRARDKELNQEEPNWKNLSRTCGRTKSDTTTLIRYGYDLERGEFPWLTAIYNKKATDLRFICGGSLISSRTILSAAHCFKINKIRAKEIVIYLGRHDLNDFEEKYVTRDVDNLIIHPDYKKITIADADIAILHLKTAVEFTQYIHPICIWYGSDDVNSIAGQRATVAGWGSDETGREVSPTPKGVESNIVSEIECLRSAQIFRNLTSSRTICAGNLDGTGPCMGDSGSGLMLFRQERWFLRGIVSTGLTNQLQCNLRQYVVYTDIAKHIEWVRQNTFT